MVAVLMSVPAVHLISAIKMRGPVVFGVNKNPLATFGSKLSAVPIYFVPTKLRDDISLVFPQLVATLKGVLVDAIPAADAGDATLQYVPPSAKNDGPADFYLMVHGLTALPKPLIVSNCIKVSNKQPLKGNLLRSYSIIEDPL